MSKFPQFRALALVVASAAGLGACQGDTGTMASDAPRIPLSLAIGDSDDNTAELGVIKVCVTGNAGGTFVFTRTAIGGSVGTALTNAVVAANTCIVVAEDNGGPGVFSSVSMTQQSAGLVSTTALEIRDPVTGPPVTTVASFTNGDSRSVNAAHGFVVTFDNFVQPPPPPPPPSGINGCSPGYWKNHAFPTDFNSSTTFSSVFGSNAYGTRTLLQVLSTGGGGLAALGRQTVSAFFNATVYPDFGYSAQGVIDAFNGVVPGSSADQTSLKNTFEALTDINDRICTNPTGK